jgi:AcrR family transcriptional regulator
MTASPTAPELTTREAILDEAELRFAERGFDGVSMREIAGAVGLRNQASLYHHFNNKQAIYEAVLARGVRGVLDAVTGDDRLSDDAVAPYLDRVLDYLSMHPQLARLIQRASLEDSVVAHELVGGLLQPLYDEGLRLLRDAPTCWEQDELPHLAAGLYHLIFGYFADTTLLRSVMGDDPASTAAVERQRRFVHHAVERLLGTEDSGQGATS